MFGKPKKRMSSSDKFVMSQGKKAGNFGNYSGSKGGSKGKETPDPYKPRTLTVGKNSGFK